MLEKIIALRDGENSVNEFLSAVRQGIPSAVFGVPDAFKNYLVAVMEDPVLYVVKDGVSASLSAQAIKELSGKKTVVLPPKDETLISARAFSKDGLFKRIAAINGVKNADVIITTAEALMQTFPKKALSLEIFKDEEISREKIAVFLTQTGYERVDSVEAKGTFAIRGDVMDVFAVNEEEPFRIDFFDDVIETIKTFDPETRRSAGVRQSATIMQAKEYTFADDDVNALLKIAEKELNAADKTRRGRLRELYDDLTVAAEKKDEGLDVFSALSVDCGTVFDLIPTNTVVVFDEAKRVYDVAVLNQTEFDERFNSLYAAGEVFSFAKKNCCGVEELKRRMLLYRQTAFQTVSAAVPFFNPLKIVNPKAGGVANYRLDFKEVFTDINNWLYSGYSVLICTADARRADMMSGDLSERGIAAAVANVGKLQGAVITAEKLSAGFVFHEEKTVVIGSGNLYAKPNTAKKLKIKKQGFFTAPEVGDYCVHETHGIGRVLGSKKISTTEGTKDYVSVEYAGGDILYVPVEQMDVLTRYLGGERKPRLSKIGGADFEKIKKSVKESIRKMSFDLKRLYSERDAAKGFAFRADEELEREFDAAFPYEETPDQITADADIKADMTSGKVMDRLICGDVGFGKTEVAYRAVFRAIVNGKQATMLAPTTILTEQHYNNAVERFKNFGVKIAVLNRFRTEKERKKIISDVKEGKIDFVIGTHRLLSKDVGFYDLGLLVLDEEQRFGVEHKEKIKLLKKNVDTLTLTATPIPRTLHMSLSGIRSISVINTPPKKRLPVQTYVTEETEVLIKDAISREINRGGQAFVLYNRVESIFTFAAKLQALLPKLKITVVHGRMEERVMEKGVMEFYRGQSDVLVSTTIIENGIDLPRANTLIVIDADRLGLSTLYQLKGRVGRSDRLAYAYFTYKRDKILSDTAFERLNAIIEFTEMGSGIKIAMRDLEIRGAGNILGAEQHGHMDKIGYELYSKLLREEISGKEEKIPELDVRVTAYIPEDYIEGSVARMDAYKEIAEINSAAAERDFKAACADAYGKIPEETENLVRIAVVKYLAMKISVSKITVSKEEVSLAFDNFKAFDNEKLMSAIDGFGGKVRISMTNEPKLEFVREKENNAEMLFVMREFLSKAVN
ncbi:MAG: transcription-repair coupling factor [Clostridia bacterium]|nr:transcription-repair coupling factor [Clostridia bacterium]